MQHVAGVIAKGEQHAAAVVRHARHINDLLRRRRSEQIAHSGAVRHALPYQSGKGGIVAGAAAHHHRHRAGLAARAAHYAAGHLTDFIRVGRDKTFDQLRRKGRGLVIEIRHD